MYDVANRESFEALPRWYSELETYVSSSVVKILVGNKVDKVRFPHFHNKIFFQLLSHFHKTTGILEAGIDNRSREVRHTYVISLHRDICEDFRWGERDLPGGGGKDP